ncbi:MAG: BBP7 family outer membrane beta-barrel protein [Lacipirellulaceae bacterium]
MKRLRYKTIRGAIASLTATIAVTWLIGCPSCCFGILDGDGIADDIDRDGHFGPDIQVSFQSSNAGLGSVPDFDDLVILPVSFQSIEQEHHTLINGTELMQPHLLTEGRIAGNDENSHYEILTGIRYYQLDDNFRVDGNGGVLGESFWYTRVVNNLVGPQITLNYKTSLKQLLFDFSGCLFLGYNLQDMTQRSAMGEDLIPGQHNHPLYFGPTITNHEKIEEDFAPLLELRATASYQFTDRIALKLTYTGTFVDNIRRASEQVRYQLPDMGFREEASTQRATINNLFAGFEAVY